MHLVLVLASCDTDGIVNDTTDLLGHDDQNEMQLDLFGHVMPLALV